MKDPIAHISEDGRIHSLIDHLTETAESASAFAADFNSAAWAHAAGIIHDLGKAHPAFQAYLRSVSGLDASEYDDQGTGTHPNHSGAGAILAWERWRNII
ncbi:MAG: CRISPR-associated endonuclease Cas3'', partial [Syntrophales bacterium LBB04]|nr:CRISPR-associated endonuclease Cas3'' [Syntrophales bacterium LBB04]